LCEEVTAKERLRNGFDEIAAVPTMWQVWRVEPTYAAPAERQCGAVDETERRTIGKIAGRCHRAELAANGVCMRRCGEELVQRAVFVGLMMRKRNIPQLRDGQYCRNGSARRGKQAPRTGVEQQWRVIDEQILIERKTTWRGIRVAADPIDRVAD